MKCLKSSALAVLSAAALFSVAGSAGAVTVDGDYVQIYRAALLCKGTGGGSLIFDAKGNIQNRGTNPVYVDCPIPEPLSGYTVTDAIVSGRDNSSKTLTAGEVRCKVVRLTLNGVTEVSGAYVGSTGAGVDALLDPVITAKTSWDQSYSLRCTIPVRATGDAISTLGNIYVWTVVTP